MKITAVFLSVAASLPAVMGIETYGSIYINNNLGGKSTSFQADHNGL
jgi:hypothetical protein